MMLTASILCPIVVGRDAETETLRQLIDAARTGDGQSVLVSGEAGVGKSRLVAEATSVATARGFRVMQGNCFQPDVACPYAPLLDLLRAYCSAGDLGPAAGALYPLLPDLAPPPSAALPPLDPEQERRRLFAALVQVVLRLAERQPLLIVIEDLHWSDDVSLDWLHLLMRRSVARPLFLLLTYRSDEVRPALRHWLATLDRERIARELTLAPLAIAEVAAMLHAMFALPQPVRREFLDAIYAFSGGNPFVVEELLTALVAAGEIAYANGAWTRKPIARLRVPRSLQDAVHGRCAGLSEGARRLLNVAAVAGHRFDLAVLGQVTGHDEPDLLPLIKALIAARLVVEESADRFAFRHALTRQAIYEDLLTRERQALHGQIASAIERLAVPILEARLPDLAYHFFEAGEWREALDYARRAAEQARALDAPRAVVEQTSRALAAADHLGQAAESDLLRSRARAHDTVGDFDAAQADFEIVLALARASGDRCGEWQALLDLGFLWTARDYAQAHTYFADALHLARAMNDPATLAHSLNRMGNWYANHEQPEPALQHHEEALAIFERLGDKPGIAATLDLLGMARGLGGDAAGGARAWEQATPLFRELNDRHALAGAAVVAPGTSSVYENDTIVVYTSLADAVPAGEQAVTLARDLDWRAGECFAMATLGESFAAAGEFGRALELLHGGLAIAEEIEHHQWMAQTHFGLGGLHGDLLALTTACAHFERCLALGEETHGLGWIALATGGLASVLIVRGELTRAEAALDARDPAAPARTLGQRLVWCAWAELALARDDPAAALTILDRMYATAANLSAESDIPRLARLKAQALAALGQAEPAEALLRAAQARAAALGARPALWRLHAALASLYRADGRKDEAAVEAGAARALIAALAETVPEGSLRANFVEAAAAMLPAATPASARRAAKAAYDGLTAREREVAGLVAQGQTNRAIADALSVSERTVEAHVANILQKLDFSARTQIAAWAVERGLTKAGT